MSPFAWLYWNPSQEFFRIPIVDKPVVWYGVIFTFGLILALFVFIHLLTNLIYQQQENLSYKDCRLKATTISDFLLWYVVLGIIIGARLGHVFFYDFDYYRQFPLDILKVWQGGLASHGGVIGVFLAILLFYRQKKALLQGISFLKLLDLVAIVSALTAGFIRLGNFMNQEIVGTPTNLPWAVVFGRAADGSLPIPRHPVQLYEALAYFLTFALLLSIWRVKKKTLADGYYLGLMFILIFGARFFLEFFKSNQASMFASSFLQAGQLLSVPFIIIGILLISSKSRLNNLKS